MSTQTAPFVPSSAFPGEPVRKASFGRRLAAFVLDAAFLSGIIGFANSWVLDRLPGEGMWWLVTTFAQVIIAALYFMIPYSTRGQTFAKSILKIKVVRVDGAALNWRTGVLRTVGYVASDILLFGYVWALWDKNKQAWHDKIAGTYVVPQSFDPTTLREAANPIAIRAQQKRWAAGLSVPVILIAGSVMAACYALTLPEVQSSIQNWITSQAWYQALASNPNSKLYDEDFDAFRQAFSDKCNPDVHVTACSIGFDYYSSLEESSSSGEITLGIDLTYDIPCVSTEGNPCERLANDYAQLVFDHYAKVDQLYGIRITVTNESNVGFVDLSATMEYSLTLDEWKTKLGIKD